LRTTAAVNPAGNTLERVITSATAEFYRLGFAASEMRTIARNAGIRSATIYYHVPSKEDLLFVILTQVMDELVGIGDTALAAFPDPVRQLSELVNCHVRYQVENQQRSTIAETELRSLTPEHYLSIVGLRDRYQQAFVTAMERGIEEGVYHFPNPRIAVYGIIAMCNEVSRWYRPDGPLTIDDISALYVRLALQAAGWRDASIGRG
jgi:AcrR family transcriptional regulator